MLTAREWHLKRRPIGLPVRDDFELVTVRLPAPSRGQVLVRNSWMSVDPYMRGRMSAEKSYAEPYALDAPMHGSAVGRVVASGSRDFREGDLVLSINGWRDAFLSDAADLTKLPQLANVSEQAFLGPLGMPGLTAYVGLFDIAGLKGGETVLVSAAAGAVGSVACQIALLKRCKVVAMAGSEEKCAWLRSIGIEAVINHRAVPDLLQAVRQAAPEGIDIYFDNVGGTQLEVAIAAARDFARFVECGMISGYNAEAPLPGPSNMMEIVKKRLTLRGFIVRDHAARQAEFQTAMAGWIVEGRISSRETVETGIEQAPAALARLFDGGNMGKMLVKLD